MTVRTVRAVIQTVVTKITRNVNAPLYDGLDDRAHCAHGLPNLRIVFFNTRVYGESNYYDKMKWQDSIKVIITQNYGHDPFEVFLKSIDLIPQQQILQRHHLYYAR